MAKGVSGRKIHWAQEAAFCHVKKKMRLERKAQDGSKYDYIPLTLDSLEGLGVIALQMGFGLDKPLLRCDLQFPGENVQGKGIGGDGAGWLERSSYMPVSI